MATSTVTGWNSNDLLWDDHPPRYCGRPGTVGNRSGNFAVNFQRCFCSWLQTQYSANQLQLNSFAKNAWKCHLDIDKSELDKPTLDTDLKIQATIKVLSALVRGASPLTSTHEGTRDTVLRHWKQWSAFNHHYLTVYGATHEALASTKDAVNPIVYSIKLALDKKGQLQSVQMVPPVLSGSKLQSSNAINVCSTIRLRIHGV